MRYHSHLNTAVTILSEYNGQQPFAHFIRDFFRQEKKYGSKDRKRISQLCYSYFRFGRAQWQLPVHERIMRGLFLSIREADELLVVEKPEWNELIHADVYDKINLLGADFSVRDIFPSPDAITPEIDHAAFALSHFIQPDLYLRLRPGYENSVANKLRSAGFEFHEASANSIGLTNSSKIDTVLAINKEVVVQDHSSQQTAALIKEAFALQEGRSVWDCCAASGGKSIMAYDIDPSIQLSVSDIRENILASLRKRFAEAGIEGYRSAVMDMTRDPISSIWDEPFDLVIADVPCTGSGTWGRTPEQLVYFDPGQIELYAVRQQKIATNVLTAVRPGGYLLYITCSVYQQENEEVVNAILHHHSNMRLVTKRLFTGYKSKADTLFAALLQRVS